MVSKAMEFINNNIKNKKILIHCNQGQSRSPSLGLVYLARNGDIPKDSYSVAAQAFLKLYPDYSPGTGIALYLEHNWDWIINEFKKSWVVICRKKLNLLTHFFKIIADLPDWQQDIILRIKKTGWLLFNISNWTTSCLWQWRHIKYRLRMVKLRLRQ